MKSVFVAIFISMMTSVSAGLIPISINFDNTVAAGQTSAGKEIKTGGFTFLNNAGRDFTYVDAASEVSNIAPTTFSTDHLKIDIKSDVIITRDGGGLFDLINFDFAANSGQSRIISGYNEGTLVKSINIALGLSLSQFSSDDEYNASEWQNLTSVQFTLGSSSVYVDNFTFAIEASATPEPASYALLGLGLLGLVGAKRQRSKISA